MLRPITLADAQLGPIHKADSRESVVKRLCYLMRRAHSKGANLIVFPELALTTFFPRWYLFPALVPFSRAGTWKGSRRSTPGSRPKCRTPRPGRCSTWRQA